MTVRCIYIDTFEMTITDCPGFHVPHCRIFKSKFKLICLLTRNILYFISFINLLQYSLVKLLFNVEN
jgi:hypothetical protein